MPRVISTGAQDFKQLISSDCFYVDKTLFIKEWWESRDIVTLITRPRRFGKTLNMSMLNCFWNIKYQGQGELFRNLDIWKEEKYRELQGSYPVISLSFARVKEKSYVDTIRRICQILTEIYNRHVFLLEGNLLTEEERHYFRSVKDDMDEIVASAALHRLSEYLYRYYGKKVIILLDEYDTPMQEAYVQGYWEELVSFSRSLFNSAFKTNPYMERAIMTGITRVSKESVFSDLNNLNVITTTSDEYATCFGFTEQEVFESMGEFGLTNKEEVKRWYDGFTFGEHKDIYNPWSIINFLNKKKLNTYWANTSSNSLIGTILRESSKNIKMQFEQLLSNDAIESRIDEEIVYNQLDKSEKAIWSLLLAAGYLKVVEKKSNLYKLDLTNYEVKQMFERMVEEWFDSSLATEYGDFIKALLLGDLDAMNNYMSQVTYSMFSFFDVGNRPSEKENPERFYHGFVLGLLVDLSDKYVITSNRESGFGRYDVMLEPLNKEDDGIILEFKVYNPRKEADLEETVQAALFQIEEKQYEQTLLDHGVKKENIRKYGFAFEGKKVLIG